MRWKREEGKEDVPADEGEENVDDDDTLSCIGERNGESQERPADHVAVGRRGERLSAPLPEKEQQAKG